MGSTLGNPRITATYFATEIVDMSEFKRKSLKKFLSREEFQISSAPTQKPSPPSDTSDGGDTPTSLPVAPSGMVSPSDDNKVTYRQFGDPVDVLKYNIKHYSRSNIKNW